MDIEVHKGTDSRYYILDTARVMPPEYPSSKVPRSIFYYNLRPEFVTKFYKPLCADGLSGFLKWDPNRNQLNDDIKEATDYLLKVTIPKVMCFFLPFSTFLFNFVQKLTIYR